MCTHTYYKYVHTKLLHVYIRTCVHTHMCTYAHMYGTAQFKLDKAHVWHVLDTTHFSFRTRAGMRALARSMT